MIDLEKFEKEELPGMKERSGYLYQNDLNTRAYNLDAIYLIQAFEAAMAALREERGRCAKIAETHIKRCLIGSFHDVHIAEEIRNK